MGEAAKAAVKTFNGAPQWAAVILIVAGFLGYLMAKDQAEERSAAREDIVTVQRIESCHSIQNESNEVMGRLYDYLAEHTKAMTALSEEVRLVHGEVEKLQNEVRNKP